MSLVSILKTILGGISNSSPSKPKKPVIPRKNITVVVDPGHGGSDPGAVYPKDSPVYIESHLALEICEHLVYILDGNGYDVVVTRADNTSPISTTDRISRIKEAKGDLLVSIHLNSFHKPAYGIETLYNSSNPDSRKIAKSIQMALMQKFPDHKDRGIKVRNNLYVLKTMSPSVLVEVEFINTAGQFVKQNTEEIALSVFKGIEQFLNS